jgi:hypothetical protein
LQALNNLKLNPPPPLELATQAPMGKGAGELFEYFLGVLRQWLSKAPKSEQSIADYFELERSQVKHWLAQAEARGAVAKSGKPARYSAVVDSTSEQRLL